MRVRASLLLLPPLVLAARATAGLIPSLALLLLLPLLPCFVRFHGPAPPLLLLLSTVTQLLPLSLFLRGLLLSRNLVIARDRDMDLRHGVLFFLCILHFLTGFLSLLLLLILCFALCLLLLRLLRDSLVVSTLLAVLLLPFALFLLGGCRRLLITAIVSSLRFAVILLVVALLLRRCITATSILLLPVSRRLIVNVYVPFLLAILVLCNTLVGGKVGALVVLVGQLVRRRLGRLAVRIRLVRQHELLASEDPRRALVLDKSFPQVRNSRRGSDLKSLRLAVSDLQEIRVPHQGEGGRGRALDSGIGGGEDEREGNALARSAVDVVAEVERETGDGALLALVLEGEDEGLVVKVVRQRVGHDGGLHREALSPLCRVEAVHHGGRGGARLLRRAAPPLHRHFRALLHGQARGRLHRPLELELHLLSVLRLRAKVRLQLLRRHLLALLLFSLSLSHTLFAEL
mmetsp:Transcript_9903/g.40116  ORF Transcript_9903/g.40116 Transcript_9903/m.40116 type:complete len:459 (-) Transcript_9903:114-1490(-)